jgi:hypothetical protein
MRSTWLTYAAIGSVVAAIIWLFIAGWAGRIVFTPKFGLLHSSEWLSWVIAMALMYGPLVFVGWMLVKAYRDAD